MLASAWHLVRVREETGRAAAGGGDARSYHSVTQSHLLLWEVNPDVADALAELLFVAKTSVSACTSIPLPGPHEAFGAEKGP